MPARQLSGSFRLRIGYLHRHEHDNSRACLRDGPVQEFPRKGPARGIDVRDDGRHTGCAYRLQRGRKGERREENVAASVEGQQRS